MFERFKRDTEDRDGGGNGRTTVAERPRTARASEGAVATRERTERGTATRDHLDRARARQREEFGGINWGAAFFGWLVAVGLGSLLLGIMAAAGAAIGLTEVSESEAERNAESIGLGGAIVLLAVLLAAYYCGGYVAGRMSRFDGARQGFGAWLFGILVTIVLTVAAVVLGSEYNVLEQLNLPSLPVGDSTFATGGAITLAIVLLGSLLAAIVGGKAGERYHKKVDRAGFTD
jgi:hypothetical protein